MKKPIKDRLIEKRKVDDTTGCWLWMGARTRERDGSLKYGTIKYHGITYTVHRLVFLVFKDINLSSNEQVNHIRECKNKHCFNPDHLYIGTQKENMADLKSTRPLPKTKMEKNREYYARHNQHREYFGRLKLT